MSMAEHELLSPYEPPLHADSDTATLESRHRRRTRSPCLFRLRLLTREPDEASPPVLNDSYHGCRPRRLHPGALRRSSAAPHRGHSHTHVGFYPLDDTTPTHRRCHEGGEVDDSQSQRSRFPAGKVAPRVLLARHSNQRRWVPGSRSAASAQGFQDVSRPLPIPLQKSPGKDTRRFCG